MTAKDQVLQALDGACVGNPAASEWLLKEGQNVGRELFELFVGNGATVGSRQLAGVTLRRQVKNGMEVPEECKREVMNLLSRGDDVEKIIKFAAADLIAEMLILRNVAEEEFLKTCMVSAVSQPTAFRLLLSLANPKPGDLNKSLLTNVLVPILTTPHIPLLPIARAVYQKYPISRNEVTPLLPALLPSIPVASYMYVADVMRLAAMLKADVAPSIYQYACEVFKYYGARFAEGNVGEEQDGLAGYYSETVAVHATINAVAGFLSSTSPAALVPHLSTVMLCCVEMEDEEEQEELDCSLAVDTPGPLRDAAVWLISNFLKDPDDGGPTPPIPDIQQAVSSAIGQNLQSPNPSVIEGALYCCQRLCEAGYLSHTDIPINTILSFMSRQDLSDHVRARASITASSLTNEKLPPDQHAYLVNSQWTQLLNPAIPQEIRIMSAIGLSKSLATTLNNSGTKGLIKVGPSIAPLLSLVPSSPVLLIETVDVVLQVLADDVLSNESVQEILPVLMNLLSTHQANTRLCVRVLRVICQGIIEEHKPGAVCKSISDFAVFIMQTILGTPNEAMQALAASALDVASTLCCCQCACGSTAMQLMAVVAQYPVEGKLAIRSRCRAMALACSATRDRQGAINTELVANYLVREVRRECDVASKMYVVSSAVSLCAHLEPEKLRVVAVECIQEFSKLWIGHRDWNWPVHLALPWTALAIKIPFGDAIAMLGPSPLEFLQAWLTVDAILEPAVRLISTAAALALLQAAPPSFVESPVTLAPIKTIYRRKPATEGVSATLGDALLLAVIRSVDKPSTPHVKTFLSKDVTIALPWCQVQAAAVNALSTLTPDRRASLQQLMNAVSCVP